MKKIICILMSILIMGTVSFAQNADAKKSKKKTESAAPKQENAQTGKMKKDGTPDMRYKENKDAKPVGPMKKDGTPDKRYKANKEVPATKKK